MKEIKHEALERRSGIAKAFLPSSVAPSRHCLYKDHVFRELARGSNAVLEPRAIAKAPEGEGCPRCGGYVYAAEQMLARGRVSPLSDSLFFILSPSVVGTPLAHLGAATS